MKEYSVYLTKPIEFNNEISNAFNFYKLSTAKAFIKQHINIYKSSLITKIYANGDWINLGEIQLTKNNRHYVANSKMKCLNY